MRRHLRLSPAGCLLLVSLLLTFPGPSIAQTATPAGSPSPARVVRTLVYHELTAFTAGPNDGGEEAPILSGDGRTIAFTRAPGTGNPATPNRIFVMNADGSGERQVDSYTSLCFCGSSIDLSADGRTVISTDSVQLRIAATGGTTGRQLVVLASNELNAARISGAGRTVFFRVYRDTTLVAPTRGQPLQRGVWAINADGTGLRQLVGPRQLQALGLPPTDFFGSDAPTLAPSADGSRLVFAAFHDPKEGGAGQGLFAVNGDGTGLHELVGRVAFVLNGTLSADGTTAAFTVDLGNGIQRVAVLPFAGGSARTLLTNAQRRPVANGGVPASDDRLQLSGDGRWALLGSSGVLAETRTGVLLALGVAGPSLAPGAAPLVGDGLFRATMDGPARRFLYLSADAKGVRQLALADLDPANAGEAPRLSDATVAPAAIAVKGGSAATVRVRVAASDSLVGVGATVLRDGLVDPDVGVVALFDDGKTAGDAVARDGIFTNNDLRTNCCAVAGPRTVRIRAQATGTDGKRHAMAVDLPFAIVSTSGSPAATPAAVTPGRILLAAVGVSARLSGPTRGTPARSRKESIYRQHPAFRERAPGGSP